MNQCSDALVSHPLLRGLGQWPLEDKIVVNNTVSTKQAVPSGTKEVAIIAQAKAFAPRGS